jgi:hypothetical protein
MVAARGYSPTQRERGCVQTEHAGRATSTETIESSVVTSNNGRESARMKPTEQDPAKAEKSSARPDRPQSDSGNG